MQKPEPELSENVPANQAERSHREAVENGTKYPFVLHTPFWVLDILFSMKKRILTGLAMFLGAMLIEYGGLWYIARSGVFGIH